MPERLAQGLDHIWRFSDGVIVWSEKRQSAGRRRGEESLVHNPVTPRAQQGHATAQGSAYKPIEPES
ncbi:MAG: hypothetical protein ACXVQR_07895, partial [Solirubrobacteraceae bacterium]